jgi:hypothetical protein
MIHADWCTRQAQPHAACYRLVGTVTVAPELTMVVELSKARDVPAVISLTVVRGAKQCALNSSAKPWAWRTSAA